MLSNECRSTRRTAVVLEVVLHVVREYGRFAGSLCVFRRGIVRLSCYDTSREELGAMPLLVRLVIALCHQSSVRWYVAKSQSCKILRFAALLSKKT